MRNRQASGAYEVAPSRRDALARLERCRLGTETNAAVFGDQGVLRSACDHLYGPQAGRWLARLFSLGHGQGVSPLATGWGAATKEVTALDDGQTEAADERITYWQRRAELTDEALTLIESALAEPLAEASVREDLMWLRTGLAIGSRLCRVLAPANGGLGICCTQKKQGWDAAFNWFVEVLRFQIGGEQLAVSNELLHSGQFTGS